MSRRPARHQFMAVSQERLHLLWVQVTDVSRECMLREQALELVYKALPAGEDENLRRLLRLNHEFVFVHKLLLDCGHALECMMIADTLIPRTAWSSAALSHSQTTGFAWASFLNFAYQFREMIKATFNQAATVAKQLDRPKPDAQPLKDALRRVEKAIGEHVALRGRNTHDYVEHNKYVTGIGALELIRQRGERYERGRHYVSLAKNLMRDDMQRSMLSCIEVLEDFYAGLAPLIAPLHDDIRGRVAGAGIEVGEAIASAA